LLPLETDDLSSLFAWARIELAAPAINGWQCWLLIRRSLDAGADPAEMAYVLVFAPTGTSLGEMVEAFGARWTVEQCFEEAKGEVGLVNFPSLLPATLPGHAGDVHSKRLRDFAILSGDMRSPVIYNCRTEKAVSFT
jgi:hypothetical protein